jgi:electron transfer flavoprotein alpha subunit
MYSSKVVVVVGRVVTTAEPLAVLAELAGHSVIHSFI